VDSNGNVYALPMSSGGGGASMPASSGSASQAGVRGANPMAAQQQSTQVRRSQRTSRLMPKCTCQLNSRAGLCLYQEADHLSWRAHGARMHASGTQTLNSCMTAG
jgi:hypothetical protein